MLHVILSSLVFIYKTGFPMDILILKINNRGLGFF